MVEKYYYYPSSQSIMLGSSTWGDYFYFKFKVEFTEKEIMCLFILFKVDLLVFKLVEQLMLNVAATYIQQGGILKTWLCFSPQKHMTS